MPFKNEEARKKYIRKYRRDHKNSIATKRHAWRKKNRHRNKNFVFKYLSEHPCKDCGESDPLVLEFDHIKGKKRCSPFGMASQSLEAIIKEIKKCIVRCANCHTKRHRLLKNGAGGEISTRTLEAAVSKTAVSGSSTTPACRD
jgi:hypothetical protein